MFLNVTAEVNMNVNNKLFYLYAFTVLPVGLSLTVRLNNSPLEN